MNTGDPYGADCRNRSDPHFPGPFSLKAMPEMMIEHENMKIPVLSTDNGWLVLDKPAGMSIHNDPGRDLCSLVSHFLQKGTVIGEKTDIDPGFGVNPVHRLDKETSGVIVLAFNREVFRFFSKQFELNQVKKRYIAILHGRLEEPEDGRQWGIWDWALAGTSGGRQNPVGAGRLQESRTKYRIIDHSAHYTMVEIELLSGRTHQIRRHAKLSGHPVVGDARYGSTRAINYLRRNFGFDRLALHARSLTILLPGGKEPETIETPAIPKQMLDLFQTDSSTA